MKPINQLRFTHLLAAATLAAASSAHAADFIWNGSVDADWHTAGNWTPGTVPGGVGGTTTDRAVFNGTGSQNAVTFGTLVGTSPNSVGGTIGMGGILVTEDQTSALSINNSAGALRNFRLSDGTGITIESGAGAFSMGTGGDVFQLVLQGNSTFTFQNDSANLATLGNKITLLPGGSFTPTVRFAGTGNWQVDGVISKGSGNTSLSKIGAGTLTLTGANSYTGATTVDAGELALTGSGSISSSSAISIADGATFRYSSTAAQTFGAISGSGDFIRDTSTGLRTFGSLSGFSGTMTFNSGLNFFTSASLGSADAAFITGSGSTGEIVFATGTYGLNFGSLSGNGNFRTQTAGSGGTVTAFIGALNTDTTFSGNMSQNTSVLAVAKVGTGTLTLSGTNTYTGKTSVTEGTLQFAKKVSLRNGATPTAAQLTVASGATLALNVGGTGEFAVADVNNLQSSTFWTAANTTTTGLQAGAKIGFDTTNATGGIFTQGNAIANSTGTNGGAIGVTKLGTGTLVLDKDNTYTGATNVNAGTLLVNGSTHADSDFTVAASATLGGTGVINGTVEVNGTIAVGLSGASIDILDTGALTMTTGSTFAYESMDISSTGADLLVVNGALSLSGVTLDLTGANLGDVTWNVGDKLTLINYDGAAITSGFDGYADDTVYTFGGNQWLLDYNDTSGGTNNYEEALTGNFITLTAVPEPTTALLGSIGVLFLLRRRRA